MTPIHHLLSLPTDSKEFYDLAHAIIMDAASTDSQRLTALRAISISCDIDSTITITDVHEYITAYQE